MYYGAYTCLMELILMIQSLFLYFESYSYISDLILVLRSIYLDYGSYTCVTELILVFRILYLYYGYESTHRYYRTYTYIEVPVGTTELILIQRYP